MSLLSELNSATDRNTHAAQLAETGRPQVPGAMNLLQISLPHMGRHGRMADTGWVPA